MWTHKAWPGRSTPASLPAGGELAAYSSAVTAVEGNTTFYALPKPQTAVKWAEAVPDNFRFMFKFPKSVTHDRKLRDVAELVHEFFGVLEPCLPNMEPVAIQLPASFGPESTNVLDQFLQSIPSSVRYAVEVRNPAFFDGADVERRLNDLLFSHGADRIILDSRAVFAGPCVTPGERDAFANKPRLPVRAVATNDRPVVRFIGQTEEAANPAYWKPWVDTVVRWLLDDRSPLVFIHTPDNAAAIDLARDFYHEVQSQLPALEPLPEAAPVQAPGLFE